MRKHHLIAKLFFALFLKGIGLFLFSGYAHAETSSEEWEFKSSIYLWMSSIKGTAPRGAEVDVNFSTILDKLDFALMAGFEANKGEWGLLTDFVYFSVSDSRSYDTRLPLTGKASLGIESWVVNLAGTKKIVDNKKHLLYVLAGMRFLSMNADLGLELIANPGTRAFGISSSDNSFDAIVGVKGEANLTVNWYLPYRFDIGTGMSDYTVNALAGAGYRFNWGNIITGYRYLHYDFGSDFDIMSDVDIHGPFLAAQWVF